MKNLLAITAFIQCAIGVWVEWWQFSRKYSQDKRQRLLPQFNNINSQKKGNEMNAKKFLSSSSPWAELWHGWKSFVYAKKKQLKLFVLLTHFFYGFSIPLNVPQETISIQSISHCHSDDFWWCWTRRGLFNPFYMRKFFVSWRRIPSIFRWRFFFVYSPQKYFLKQIIFKLSLSLGNAFSYFSIFHFFHLLRVAIWIEAENKKMGNFYGTKRKCVEK